jgi:hypothetical protein
MLESFVVADVIHRVRNFFFSCEENDLLCFDAV